ncbi:MAG: phosphoribosylformylglycinamidine synthase subunit PurQ [Pseudomonadota bacterium]
MKTAVVVFPGSNCDRDLLVALEGVTGRPALRLWHKETALPVGIDLVALPGGFSFGDYLRCGAIAARAPIMQAILTYAGRGGRVLGVCNGFQVLIEMGLLPGALMRNAGLRFVCRPQPLVAPAGGVFAGAFPDDRIVLPIAHHDGNYLADPDLLRALQDEGRIALRYADSDGAVTGRGNPNGSIDNIAGITAPGHRILGLMPHPERQVDPAHGGRDGARLLSAFLGVGAEV